MTSTLVLVRKTTKTTRAARETASLKKSKKLATQWQDLWNYLAPKAIIALSDLEDEFVADGWFHPRHDIRMNSDELREMYGRSGYEFIRHICVKYQNGGVIRVPGQAIKYPTRWKLNVPAILDFAKVYDLLSVEEKRNLTCTKALEVMVATGHEPIERVKIRDDEGLILDIQFLTTEERKSVTPSAWRDTFREVKLTEEQEAKL